MTPEERAAYEAQKAEWNEESRRFREMAERYSARTQALKEEERRLERRRRLVRRFLPFLPVAAA